MKGYGPQPNLFFPSSPVVSTSKMLDLTIWSQYLWMLVYEISTHPYPGYTFLVLLILCRHDVFMFVMPMEVMADIFLESLESDCLPLTANCLSDIYTAYLSSFNPARE